MTDSLTIISNADRLSVWEQVLLGVYHAMLVLALSHIIYTVWPQAQPVAQTKANKEPSEKSAPMTFTIAEA